MRIRACRTICLLAAFGLVNCLLVENARAAAREPRADAAWRIPACVTDVLSPQKKRFPHPLLFSATRILDLEFRVTFLARGTDAHRLDVKVYAPDHQLYQTLSVWYGAEAVVSRRSTRRLSGLSRPEAEGPMPVTPGRDRPARVRTVLPVAGTSIVANSLYGEWSALAFLDENPTPCGPGARFVIEQ